MHDSWLARLTVQEMCKTVLDFLHGFALYSNLAIGRTSGYHENKTASHSNDIHTLQCTVEIAFYDHPLVQKKTVLKGRWSEKQGSLRHAHAVRLTNSI